MAKLHTIPPRWHLVAMPAFRNLGMFSPEKEQDPTRSARAILRDLRHSRARLRKRDHKKTWMLNSCKSPARLACATSFCTPRVLAIRMFYSGKEAHPKPICRMTASQQCSGKRRAIIVPYSSVTWALVLQLHFSYQNKDPVFYYESLLW